jgi:uncharacterized protein
MEFDWDEAKRISNLTRHGVDFAEVSPLFDGEVVTIEDRRFNYGEVRYVTFGLLQGRVLAIVHTEIEDCIRIISARRAIRHEQEFYFQSIGN